MIEMNERSISLLRELTEAHGAPGFEQEIREIFRKHTQGEFITDNLGSIYVGREGSSPTPRIMVSGHLDEVGFVVQSVTSDGYIRFLQMGRTWEPVMISQKVRILVNGKEILGTIASKPPHFMTEEDFNKPLKTENLLIDVGAENLEDVKNNYGIRPGQPIVFDSSFRKLHHTDRFIGKAFDNRVGVALAMECARELLKTKHPNTVFCGANAQEEVKARGAKTASFLLNPDLAIVLEGVPADDFPGTDKNLHQGALGKGVQIRVMDATAIMNQNFNQFVISIAEKYAIPYQLSVRQGGGTDASNIHLNAAGVPSVVLGVPVRYSHSSNCIIDLNDYQNTLKLIVEVIRQLDLEVCEGFTKF